MSFSQPNAQMYVGGEPQGDGGQQIAPGVGGAPGMGDGQGQFPTGSIPAPAGGAGTPTNPESKTTLWYVKLLLMRFCTASH